MSSQLPSESNNFLHHRLSQFNDKVESFEDFFFTFKQRINEIEEKSHQHDQLIEKNKNSVIKFKSDSDT